MSFEEVDKLFGTTDVLNAYNILKKRNAGGDNDVEVLWRLAKCCHELSSRSVNDKPKRKEYLLEGEKYGLAAVKANEKHFFALKYAAVITGKLADELGTKERIEHGKRFKEFIDRALAVDNSEYALYHMRGRFSFSVANVTFLEKKVAQVFYATPPAATIDEALADFLIVHEKKSDWIENLLMIGKCYLQQKDKANARKYLSLAAKVEPLDEEEVQMLTEVNKLLAKC